VISDDIFYGKATSRKIYQVNVADVCVCMYNCVLIQNLTSYFLHLHPPCDLSQATFDSPASDVERELPSPSSGPPFYHGATHTKMRVKGSWCSSFSPAEQQCARPSLRERASNGGRDR
jgi:hypothetical protein